MKMMPLLLSVAALVRKSTRIVVPGTRYRQSARRTIRKEDKNHAVFFFVHFLFNYCRITVRRVPVPCTDWYLATLLEPTSTVS